MKGRQFSLEEAKKGGQTPSLYKSLSRTLMARKHCTTSCVYFEKCPVNAVSFGSADKKCMMKEFPLAVRQQFVDMFLSGEEGIIHAIKKALDSYMNDVNTYGNWKDKRDMIKLMLEFYDKVYNNTRKSAVRKEPLTITVRRVDLPPQTLTIKPREALPEGIKVIDIMSPANEDITEGDPESLINSPILAEVMRPVERNVVLEEIRIESNIEDILHDDET